MRAVSKKPLKRVRKYYNGGQNWPPEVKARMLASGNWEEGPNGELLRVSAEEANQAALQQSRQEASPEKYTPTEVGFMGDERREYLENVDRPLTRAEAQEYATETYNPTQPFNIAFSSAAGVGTPYAALEDYLIGRFLQSGKGGLNYLLTEGQAKLGPYLEKGYKKGLELYDKYAPSFGAEPLPRKTDWRGNDVIQTTAATNRLLPLEVQQAILRTDVTPKMQRRWAELGEITSNKIAQYSTDPILETIENPEVRTKVQRFMSSKYPDANKISEFIFDNRVDLSPEVIDHLIKFEDEMRDLAKEANRWEEAYGLTPTPGAAPVGNPPILHPRSGAARVFGQDQPSDLAASEAAQDAYIIRRDQLGDDLDKWNTRDAEWLDTEEAMERVPVATGDNMAAKFEDIIGGDMTRRARVQMEVHSYGGNEGMNTSRVNAKVGKDEWPSAKKEFVVYRNQAPTNIQTEYTEVSVMRNGRPISVGRTNNYKEGDLISGLSQSPMGEEWLKARNEIVSGSTAPKTYRPTSTSLSSGLDGPAEAPGALGPTWEDGRKNYDKMVTSDRKIKIVVPEGTPAVGAQQYTGRSGYPSEQEVLLHHDQKYVVTNISPGMVEMKAISDAEYNRLLKQSGGFSQGGRVVKSRKPGFAVVK